MKPLDERPPLLWKTILAPTDFSKPSRNAVATAARLAEQGGANIILLHMIHLPASGAIEAGMNMDEVVRLARESLADIAGEIPSARVREKLVRLGPQGTVPGIIDAAREFSADLIVIATHGHSRLERVLLGSTAEKVVRHAPCPVLVVRRKEALPTQNPNQPGSN